MERLVALLDRDRLGQVSGLIYVAAAADGDVIGQQLQGHDLENRREFFRRGGNVDHVVGGFLDFFVAFGRERDHLAGAGFHFFQV